MPITLTKQTPKRMWKYPHMLHEDTILWQRFLDTANLYNCEVAYDVHVGTPATFSPDTPENYKRMIERLSTLRIDAVLFYPNRTHIIEIKPHAGIVAIGQVLGYSLLYHREYPHHPKPTPTILTDTALPDTPWLCRNLGILLIQLD